MFSRYYTTVFSCCQVFFQKNFRRSEIQISRFWCDSAVYRKSTQKGGPAGRKILTRILFHKNIRAISSLLNIYKIALMRYNIYAVGNRRQVPSVAHCKDRSAKCQAHDISAQKRQVSVQFYFCPRRAAGPPCPGLRALSPARFPAFWPLRTSFLQDSAPCGQLFLKNLWKSDGNCAII